MITVLEKVFSNIYKLGLFAVLFFFAVVTFFAKDNIEPIYQSMYHYGFIVFSFLIFLVLMVYNQIKPLFFVLVMLIGYIVLNYLRNHMIIEGPMYHNMGLFLALNLLLSVFVVSGKVATKKNLLMLVVLFLELAFIEHLSNDDYFIKYNFVLVSIVGGVFLFVYSSIKNKVLEYSYFFSYMLCSLGYYYAISTSGFTMFFGVALMAMMLSIAMYLYFFRYINPVSKVKNKRAFLSYSKLSLIKYSMAIINIDDFINLEQKFGGKNLNTLVYLLSNIIKDKHLKVFHIRDEYFILVFENMGIDDAYEEVEEIRRKIFSTEFVLKNYKNHINLTISAAVVERKRSDANIFAVFYRAQKMLSKTKNFNNNFTSKG